ncbi:hypothetical protein I4U23_027995 [Adineta vaga]|nr:hypothetical protein I4U23_027995 [Adineta vaga]
MSEISGQCEDQSCLNHLKAISRVFPCLYHCQKMLCIQHLSEHDKYIEKQLQYQNQLEDLWTNYHSLFNEEKVEEEFQKLKIKLDNFRQLNHEIKHLLSLKNFHDSIENNEKLQIGIQMVQKAIEQENQSESMINTVHLKTELIEDENHSTIDFEYLASSDTTNDGSETGDSFPSFSNTNANSPPIAQEDDDFENMDESDEHENNMESETEDNTMDENNCGTKITSRLSIVASKIRDYCPLTHDGAFGINAETHGVRLCPKKPLAHQRTYRLNEHFRRVHHLTGFASLALARAVGAKQNPLTTRLFNDHDTILNIEELRTINCPINQPFLHHSLLQIENYPCKTVRQVRHLRDHLKRSHKFTNRAANIIVKAVKNNRPVHMIEFPQWINVLEDENPF